VPEPAADGSGSRPAGNHLPPGEFRKEIWRKAIHLSSIVIPVFYFFTPKETALLVSATLMVLATALDLGRHYYSPVRRLFHAIFGSVLRSHERDRHAKRLNGGTYVLIAATLSILVFPKLIAITGFLILIVSDLAAALIGKKFGKRKFLGKSVEGSSAFFVTAMMVIAVTPKVGYGAGEYLLGAAAALAATVVEAGVPWIDDNLSIPLTVGVTLWAGYALLFPGLDVFRFG
jgi:dolichol kinase